MLLITEAMKLTDIDEINEEIRQREDLIGQMVGWLYPDILRCEIARLNPYYREELKEALEKKRERDHLVARKKWGKNWRCACPLCEEATAEEIRALLKGFVSENVPKN